MARNIGPTVDILLSRSRQSGGIALSTDVATQILTLCQNVVNFHTKSVIETGTLTTEGSRLVYSRSDYTWGRVLAIHEANRKLIRFNSLDEISAYDIDWFRKVDATRFEGWIQFGLSYLILYPGKAGASSVSVTNIKELTVYDDYSTYYNTAMELPDDDVDIALRLAETLLLTRGHNQEALKASVQQMARRVGKNVLQ